MEDSGSSSGTSASRGGSIGSLHTPSATPVGRLSSLRGGRGGAGPSTPSTRGGATKIQFKPTIPSKRNKKDAALSLLEEAKAGSGSGAESGRGGSRGRGERGGGRGRGRGRGRPDDVIGTASGPFSLGPAAMARSRAIAMGGGASGAHASYTGVQLVKSEGGEGMSGEDREYYGDAAVDMKFGSTATDASAPTGLETPGDESKAGVKDEKLKEQDMEGVVTGDRKTAVGIKTFEGTSEDENEGDDEDIKLKMEGPAQDLMPSWIEDQMFFFQFPSVMPSFKPRPVSSAPMSSVIGSSTSSPAVGSSLYSTPDDPDRTEGSDDGLLAVKPEPMDQDRPILVGDNDLLPVKSEQQEGKVGVPMVGGEGSGASAPAGQRAKPKAPTASAAGAAGSSNHNGKSAGGAGDKDDEESHLQQEGKIGRLLIYKSGKVKMKVGDIIMDVSSGSECSFLQDVVVVDSNNKQAFVMGSVQKRMVCVPNLTQLLNGLEAMDV
ncbi:hypothetical protein BGZ70_008027 [Mortierella alpina]|uniref:RNA polymerase III RPC4-domain-containing protein n=1 Tax=Mortierella alpina TaxID=64518 RepID=A0A9P6J4F5_MORAP|nr:hypothetical protein BGZ70_008027 [Mortierella alpina]